MLVPGLYNWAQYTPGSHIDALLPSHFSDVLADGPCVAVQQQGQILLAQQATLFPALLG